MFISPMLLQVADKPFDDVNFLFEIKHNGVRLLLDVQNDTINYYSRHNTVLTGRFPELNNLKLPSCYLDGELVCFRDYSEDFEAVMARVNSKSKKTIDKVSMQYPLTYVVFDILELNGISTINRPLIERKELLVQLFEDSEVIRRSIQIRNEGEILFEKVRNFELEGIVAKRIESTYQINKRSFDWLKIINWRYYSCYIYGYKKKGNGFLIKFSDSGESAGYFEFGMSYVHKEAFYKAVKEFKLKIRENDRFVFIDPRIKCKVKGRGKNFSGNIMTPVFVDFEY